MRLPVRPPSAVLVTLVVHACVISTAVGIGAAAGDDRDAGARSPVAAREAPPAAPRTRVGPRAVHPPTPSKAPDAAARPAPAPKSLAVPSPPPAGAGWSGFAFDACRAPSQRVMDRWLRTSPFLGVGIYLGGVHRACEQRHLTRGWVARQTGTGWHLLPLWVGPQASCTGYHWRIDSRPGRERAYRRAVRDGGRQARLAAGAARRLGIAAGQTLWYDIEPFPTGRKRCRQSALAFLDAWTRELHRLGYRSGVYSHARAGIALLHRAPRRIARPDAVWFAWVSPDAGVLPRRFVRDPSWKRNSRVHQFALDRRVRFGGISMDIDWNYVNLHGSARSGQSPRPEKSAPCGPAADLLRPSALATGSRGPAVGVVKCLLAAAGRHAGPVDDLFGPDTRKAVLALQRSKGLEPSGAVDRRTWMALLAPGRHPVLKKGSGGEPVRRLQRTLNAALPGGLTVDGRFGPVTAKAVRRYQKVVGHRDSGIVTRTTWRALARGQVTAPSPARTVTKTRAVKPVPPKQVKKVGPKVRGH